MKRLNHRVMCQKYADGMSNSAYPDQTAPIETILSGSALFAKAWVLKNIDQYGNI